MRRVILLLSIMAIVCGAKAQTIYPTPQKITVNNAQVIPLTQGAKIYGADKADVDAVNTLKGLVLEEKNGVKVTIGKVDDKATKKYNDIDIPNISGAYYLKVDSKDGIVIIGADDRGTYYAVQTLRQLIVDNSIAECEILDYPDTRYRGSVEGFYGTPWSHQDRLSQLKFYGENKLNTYIYGPKDDPYHSSLSNHADTSKPIEGGWRVPYPQKEGAQISELAEAAKQSKVDFVWAIHPGQDIKWIEEDYQNLKHKFEDMYELGVRSFAVFFDDISGEGTDATKQAELLNRINREFIQQKTDVTPLVMCPTEYNKSCANPTEQGYLSILGRNLDPTIEIMWTGDYVCCDITTETVDWVTEKIKRPVYIWWNFPVTDYVHHIVLQGPSYGLTQDVTSKDMSGFVSNPMEHAEASKIALYGVADYTWNISDYNYLKCWENSFNVIMPEAADAYRTFAIHSSDLELNGNAYRRDESWETTLIDPLNYTQTDYDNLKNDYIELGAAAETIKTDCTNASLVEELTPWLNEAVALSARGVEIMDFIKVYETGSRADIWSAYLKNQFGGEALSSYNRHKVGTLLLQPFITQTHKLIGKKLYEDISGEAIETVKPIASYQNQELLEKIIDSDDNTFYHSWALQEVGDWIGVDLGREKEITNIFIKQGRREGDTDSFKSAVLEISSDSIAWTILDSITNNQFIIRYSAKPVNGRYVRLRSTDVADTKYWAALSTFAVNPTVETPVVYTTLPQLSLNQIKTDGNAISMQPVFEVVKVQPQSYFGIELPRAVEVKAIKQSLGVAKPTIQYSVDGENWSTKMQQARFIRYINATNKAVEVSLKEFAIEIDAAIESGESDMFDKDLNTEFTPNKPITLIVPKDKHTLTILAKEPISCTISSVASNGKVIATTELDGVYIEYAIDSLANSISITSTMPIAEIVFGE